ncbi:MAG TPA: hypothetical protein VGE01_08130 [Fimbriimonas sp.]
MRRAIAFALVFLALLPALAVSQTSEPEFNPPVTVDAKDQDVRDVLRTVFTTAKVSFILDPKVEGKLNLGLQGIPFEQALDQILGQVGATYRLEGGVYHVVPRVQVLDPTLPVEVVGLQIVDLEVVNALKRLPGKEVVEVAPGVSGRVTVVGIEDEQELLNEIARQVDARVLRSESGYRLVPRHSLRRRIGPVRHADGDLRQIVIGLLDQAGIDYIVSGGIAGKTTVNIGDTDVQSALEAILAPIGGRISLRQGVFIVSAR